MLCMEESIQTFSLHLWIFEKQNILLILKLTELQTLQIFVEKITVLFEMFYAFFAHAASN